ncbi:lysylphosphatidylglycerol synthase domain-containing protein [Croceicoccus gelatinilyticus]|uniref:lysylphosphatidylglycerol synthase domain-containing protein n=1 Tax=Croceicoccus gelatinilyticus TaxID=2835536 RepID=UPI001BCFBBC8|nr:lysylphosphatidylglycerol synthase domain-containing protein [Croceicoccus gelatinilyticus]MBS7670772.1 flippase-like domain-containing protein [Croceicoccus gelatinilyticus]
MATRRIAFRSLAALVVSGATLSILIKLADLDWRDYSRIGFHGFSLVVGLHILALLMRGWLMSQLSHKQNEGFAGTIAWVHLAARHQFIFTVLPTGLGDLLFPALAKRLVGRTTANAFSVIAQVRSRDLVMLITLALGGGLIIAGNKWVAAAFGIPALAVLFYSDKVFRLSLRIVRRPLPHGKLADFLEAVALSDPPKPFARLKLTLASILDWIFVTCSVVAAFDAIGQPVSVGVAMLFLAGINFFGALAISIGGLGISETGGAAALVLADRSVKNASALSLLTRPLLLVSMLSASVLIDLILTGAKLLHRR